MNEEMNELTEETVKDVKLEPIFTVEETESKLRNWFRTHIKGSRENKLITFIDEEHFISDMFEILRIEKLEEITSD